MKNSQRNELIETLVFNVIFTIGILAIFIIISALSVDYKKLFDIDFWILTSIKVGALGALFNWYRFTGIKISKKKKQSYKKSIIMHSKMCDQVKANNLRFNVESKLLELNNKNLLLSQETALEKLTGVITLDQIKQWSIKELAHESKLIGYGWFHRLKLIKLSKRIKKGKIAYVKYDVHHILHNQFSTKVGMEVSDSSEPVTLINENIYIMLRYALFTSILTLVNWNGNLADIVVGIIINLTLAFSAMFSGTKSADDYVGRCTDRLNNKNDILAEVEGISYAQIEQEANMLITKEFYRNET